MEISVFRGFQRKEEFARRGNVEFHFVRSRRPDEKAARVFSRNGSTERFFVLRSHVGVLFFRLKSVPDYVSTL